VVSLESRLEKEFEILGEPDWMAEGFGSVWVSRTDPEGEGNFLDRIDPSTNEVAASIPVGRHPCHGVAVGFDAVWVPTCIDQRIVQVDPAKNKVVRSFDVPLHRVDGDRIVAAFEALWIVSPDPKGGDALARIDPGTGNLETIPLPTLSTQMVEGFGSLWVMSPEGGTVHRVDPKSMSVVGSIEGLREPETAAAGDGVLWVNDAADGTVAGVDPKSLAITDRIPIGGPGLGGGIAADASGIWFRPANYLLGRIDPATREVTEIFAEPPALGEVLLAFDSVWFSAYTKDTVWRITV
jgi:virginiamycin B lyase